MAMNHEQSVPQTANDNTSPDTTQNGDGSPANTGDDKQKKNGSTDQEPEDEDIEGIDSKWRQWWRAYGATLYVLGSFVHIVASIVTVALFFISPFPFPLSEQSVWLIPVTGSISTYLAFLIIAFFYHPYIGTAQGASTQNFGQLKARLDQLEARLYALGISTKYRAGIVADNSTIPTDKHFTSVAKEEARRCYESARWYLKNHTTGLRWVTGMGYNNTWGLIHRTEEALVKFEPAELVFRGALHDRLAILKSKIGKRNELLNKLTIAVAQLYPEGEIYVRDNTSDDTHRLQTIEDIVKEILTNQHKPQKKEIDDTQQTKKDAARLTLSEIRRTLNEYRDNIWAKILHERNRLMNTISITGLVTHILLCIIIVIMYKTSTDKTLPTDKTLLMAATMYYVIGAIAGLFSRFWNEIHSDNAPDDFGLSMARLFATPLLSGLAGIGGVIISLLLSDALTNAQSITFAEMFQFRPGFFLTAAAFGLAPDLIIMGLQQKVARYSSDLSISKSGGQGADSI